MTQAKYGQELRPPVACPANATTAIFSSSGESVLYGTWEGSMVWMSDVSKPFSKVIETLVTNTPITGIVLTDIPVCLTSSVSTPIQKWFLGENIKLLDPNFIPVKAAAIAISPNKKILATYSEEHVLQLWDANSGRPIKHDLQSPDHKPAISHMAFSPDNETLTCVGCVVNAQYQPLAGYVETWDLVRHRQLGIRLFEEPNITALTTYDNEILASAGYSVYKGDPRDLNNFKRITVQTPTAKTSIRVLEISPNRANFLVGAGNILQEFDLSSGDAKRDPIVLPNSVQFANYTADNSQLQCVTTDGKIRCHSVQEVRKFYGPAQVPIDLF